MGDARAAGARRSGAIVAALDLHTHEAVVEHSGGRAARVALTPDRAVADVTRELLGAVGTWGRRRDRPDAQEVPWKVPLDEDREHATYDAGQVRPTSRPPPAARVLGRVPRALPRPLDPGQRLVGHVRPRGPPLLRCSRPSRPRMTSSCATMTPSRSPSAGGPATRLRRAAFFAYAHPAPDGFAGADPARPPTGTTTTASTCSSGPTPSPRPTRMRRARVRPLRLPPRVSRLRLGPGLPASAEGDPPPVR